MNDGRGGKPMSSGGSSELEAQVNVKAKCMAEYDKILCEDYDCKKAE